jgi:hypothetical protein
MGRRRANVFKTSFRLFESIDIGAHGKDVRGQVQVHLIFTQLLSETVSDSHI